jgi:predicted anti-sigma-YlaC factor YlaD
MTPAVSNGITCREVVEVVTLYLDGAMPPEMRVRFEEHLALCEGCVAYVDQMRRTARLVRTAAEREQALSPRAREELVRVFRDWKRT